ncbi:MAG: hypothetical protein M1568_04360 [Acidobacteria bacterium]|jgi:hypothetical protein|nr:hypothetical protein [Acidobacteriota bacterium]
MMKPTNILSSFLIATLSLAPVAAFAQNSNQGFTQQQVTDMVWTAVKTEIAAANNDHSVFIFHDHDIQPQKNKYTIVIQTTSHGSLNRITQLNGQAVPIQQQSAKIDNFVNSPALQQKQRQSSRNDAQQTEQLLKMIPDAFLWSVTNVTPREVTLSYKPNPDFNPPTMEDRVFAAMAGEMVLDREQNRIVVFKGRLIHNVNFFWGLLGHMNQGGTFCVVRKELEPYVWEIVETRVHINGHILFFKTISQNEDDYDTDFRPAPPNISLEDAAKIVMEQPDWPNAPGTHDPAAPEGTGACSSH